MQKIEMEYFSDILPFCIKVNSERIFLGVLLPKQGFSFFLFNNSFFNNFVFFEIFIKEKHGLENCGIFIPVEVDGRVGSYGTSSQLPALFTLPVLQSRRTLQSYNESQYSLIIQLRTRLKILHFFLNFFYVGLEI